jgi:hypothetical protein
MWRLLHANEKAAAIAVSATPVVDIRGKVLPSAEVKITDAKVCVVCHLESISQGWKESLLYIIEDTRHSVAFFAIV